jgi:hypothetical protein
MFVGSENSVPVQVSGVVRRCFCRACFVRVRCWDNTEKYLVAQARGEWRHWDYAARSTQTVMISATAIFRDPSVYTTMDIALIAGVSARYRRHDVHVSIIAPAIALVTLNK